MKRLLPIALTLAFAAPAHAAEYRVYACDGPGGAARGMRPFDDFEIPADSMNHDDRCQAGEDAAYFEWAPGTLVQSGRRGGWALDAPAGAFVSKLGWTGSAAGVSGSGARVEIARDDTNAPLWEYTGNLANDLREYFLPAGTTRIVLRQACRAVLCAPPVRTTIRQLTVALEDASPPTANGFAGTLSAGGPRHGAAALTFAAGDAGSGLMRAALEVDGAVHSVPLGDCTPLAGDARGFETAQPCARSAPAELRWDTAGVRDGAHTVSATLEDAAGNTRTVFGPITVTTDNEPPSTGTVTVARAGQTLTATPNGFDGQDVAYAYRWQRCDPDCDDIDAATHARYALTAADADHAVRAVITATDLGGTSTARSATLAIEPATPTPTPTASPTPTATSTPSTTLGAEPAPAAPPTAPPPAAPACASTFAAPPLAAVARHTAPPLAAVARRTAAPLAAVVRHTAAPFGRLAAPLLASAAAVTPCARVSLSRRTIRVAYGTRIEVRGRVTDAHGAPLAGATLDVMAKLRVRGAGARREGGVGSAGDGRFSYVAPAGASRDLTLGGATVSLLVTAAGTFNATRHGATVRFSGRLRGGHIPRGGVLVEIRAGRRVVALARTDGRGAYRATRRVTRRSFTARTRADSSWPFVSAAVGSPVSA